jgi:hypothetical protein
MGITHPIRCPWRKKAQPTARVVGWKNRSNGTQEVDRVNFSIDLTGQ